MKTQKSIRSLPQGFTLIELLVVIGILAILLAITLVAINPAKQFAQANNTKREADVNALLNAIDQYASDHNGTLPGSLSAGNVSTPTDIANTGVDLCSALVPTYIAALPSDPTSTDASTNGQISGCPTPYDTAYQVENISGGAGRISVSASYAQAINGVTPSIVVTR
jgi:type IV pilus assembly protein PilA